MIINSIIRAGYSQLSSSKSILKHRLHVLCRSFSTEIVSTIAKVPDYNLVPFVKEELETVIQEVPEFRYYILGEEEPKQNIFANVALDEAIIKDEEIPVYKPTDGSTMYSKLENGLRVASIDRGGLTASLGLFVNAGSRYEDSSSSGVSHMLEVMAFHSTAHLSWLRTIKTVETLGAKAACNAGREHMVYSSECLRQYMPILVPIMIGNILFPRFLPWELKDNTSHFQAARDRLEKNPDSLVTELLHTTAWHNNTLGNKLYATDRALANFNPETIRSFMMKHFSPANMVFVGVNVNHSELCKWLMRTFIDYPAIPSQSVYKEKPVYTGGDCRIEGSSQLSHVAIAFETPGGWNNPDLVALTVLQSLMGGGGAFSTGGPGKGMYSRLFLNVLNQYSWVESCMAFNTQYSDSGLFGIYMTASASKGYDMVRVIANEFVEMARATNEELDRAKACLKASIWMNLECRSIVLEDVARQLLMSNKVVSGAEFCTLIDKVTESDLKRVTMKLLNQRPTVVAYGDLYSLPHYDQICQIFKQSNE